MENQRAVAVVERASVVEDMRNTSSAARASMALRLSCFASEPRLGEERSPNLERDSIGGRGREFYADAGSPPPRTGASRADEDVADRQTAEGLPNCVHFRRLFQTRD